MHHLDQLEAEAIHVIREVAAELEKPVLLFSGGKDSIVLLHLARKAFRPGELPFPVMHVDTGHNFPEVIEFRDRHVPDILVASVQESIDEGRVRDAPSRNQLQTTTLLDAIEEHGFDAAFGGARRDEERARAKERVFSFRDDFGQWDPRRQRPELWDLYNGRVRRGEHVRVFPLSNWTELDVWEYIRAEDLELPSIYFAHEREVFERDGMVYAVSEFLHTNGDTPFTASVRYRTVGDMTCTGAVRSQAHAARRRDRRDRRHADHRARRDARRRPRERGRHGGPQAGGVLLVLRVATAGSVDDGKSTLIGRLLHDSKSLMADELGTAADLARLTDGLRAEREQGITIDVAYRHFATPSRRFVLHDCPGHAQYTRNMATGASTADLALVLVDARRGMTEQSRRHLAIAALLGVPNVTVLVNKMDLVGYAEERFDTVAREVLDWSSRLGLHGVGFIPVSALHGDNVVDRSAAMTVVQRPVAARAPGVGPGRQRARRRPCPAAGAVRDPRRRDALVRRPARVRDAGDRRRAGRAPRRHPHPRPRVRGRRRPRRRTALDRRVAHRRARRRPRRPARAPRRGARAGARAGAPRSAGSATSRHGRALAT